LDRVRIIQNMVSEAARAAAGLKNAKSQAFREQFF